MPDSAEIVRVEFMGPDEHKRQDDLRVDVQDGVHARVHGRENRSGRVGPACDFGKTTGRHRRYGKPSRSQAACARHAEMPRAR
jgi:hypothetical protein